MKPSQPWFERAIWAFLSWLDKKSGPGTSVERRTYERDWDYEQADLQPWDGEPDRSALAEALALAEIDPIRAFTRLYRLAEGGSPLAMSLIGERYYWGTVVSADAQEAERWFQKAYEGGSHRGLLNSGLALFKRRDFEGAEAVFRDGVGVKLAPAYYWLARAQVAQSQTLRAVRPSLPMLEQAAELGSPAAKATVAAVTALGFYGLRRIPRGFRLFAAELANRSPGEQKPLRTNASGQTVH